MRTSSNLPLPSQPDVQRYLDEAAEARSLGEPEREADALQSAWLLAPGVETTLALASHLLRTGQARRAERLLAELLSESVDAVTPHDRCELLLGRLAALLELQRWDEASTVRDLVDLLIERRGTESQRRACELLTTQLYLVREEWSAALKFAQDALRAAASETDPEWQADMVASAGLAAQGAGDHATASRQLWAAYELHRGLGDDYGAACDLVNLASSFVTLKRWGALGTVEQLLTHHATRCGADHLLARGRAILNPGHVEAAQARACWN